MPKGIEEANELELLLTDAKNCIQVIGSNSEAFKTFLISLAHMPNEIISNLAILSMNCSPPPAEVHTCNEWKNLGRFVKKGEIGVSVLVPNINKNEKSFTTGKVFDVSQTVEAFDIAKTHSNSAVADIKIVMKKLLQSSPVQCVPISDAEFNVRYNNETKIIEIKKGLDKNDLFMGLAQEIAHAYYAQEPEYTRSSMAFYAYSVSYLLTKYYRLDCSNYDFSASSEWLSFGDEETNQDEQTQIIKSRLGEIRSVFRKILEKLEPGSITDVSTVQLEGENND